MILFGQRADVGEERVVVLIERADDGDLAPPAQTRRPIPPIVTGRQCPASFDPQTLPRTASVGHGVCEGLAIECYSILSPLGREWRAFSTAFCIDRNDTTVSHSRGPVSNSILS